MSSVSGGPDGWITTASPSPPMALVNRSGSVVTRWAFTASATTTAVGTATATMVATVSHRRPRRVARTRRAIGCTDPFDHPPTEPVDGAGTRPGGEADRTAAP